MAATSRFTRRCFGSSIIFPRPSSLRAQFRVFSCVPNYFSTYYVRNDASRCKTTSKIVAVSRIRSMCSESSGSELGWSVKTIIGENPVVVFSKTWCSYSMEVKSLFKGLGVEPFVVELDQLEFSRSSIAEEFGNAYWTTYCSKCVYR
ncbi:hypothetical protein OROHE_005290 [Orobanche hederae]